MPNATIHKYAKHLLDILIEDEGPTAHPQR
jgi:hypothetical protein